jgi:DnaJ-class molecular chaperone
MSKYYCPCCFGHHEEGIEHCKAFSQLPSLEGIMVEEKCPDTCHYRDGHWWNNKQCPTCQGAGTITRQAEWGEVMELVVYSLRKIDIETMGKMKREEVDKNDNIQFILKSGGRLRVKE